jgi:hypothetical protein
MGKVKLAKNAETGEQVCILRCLQMEGHALNRAY